MRQNHLYLQLRRIFFSILRFLLGFLLLTAAGASAYASVSGPGETLTRTTTRTTSTRTTLSTAASDGAAVLTARVETATGEAVSGGTVDFVLPSGQSLGSALAGADGTATLRLSSIPAGLSTATRGIEGGSRIGIAAEFHGAPGSGLAASVSPAEALAVPAATSQAPDFSVTGSPTTVTTTAGSYGTSTLTIASVGNYTGSVQFSCANLPAQVTCTFNPTQQTLTANGSFTSTLQLQTQAASGPQTSVIATHGGVELALIVPGALLLFGLAGRRRKLFRGARMLGVVLVLTAGGLGLSGCSQRYGYLHHPPPVATGTPAGTYPITVAVDGNQGSSALDHTITISLVVQ